jgi:ribonuclease-3
MTNFKEIEKKIGYEFKNKETLITALTHKSASEKHNERLEFLGDAILCSVITSEIFTKFKDKNEGTLSRIRSNLIKKEKLIEVATRIDLTSYIKLSNSEHKRRAGAKDAILADALEAVIGAIFIDSNWEICSKIIINWYKDELTNDNLINQEKDPKTKLQEAMQAIGRNVPEYELVKTEGQEHEQIFTVSCKVKGLRIKTNGSGKTIKKAEQIAAKAFIEKLQLKEKV